MDLSPFSRNAYWRSIGTDRKTLRLQLDRLNPGSISFLGDFAGSFNKGEKLSCTKGRSCLLHCLVQKREEQTTMRILRLAEFGLCFGLIVGAAGAANARKAANNPAVGGQINQCWGQIASGLAQFDSPNVTSDMNGGGMGMHSRSSQGATNNGGFANSPFGFGPGSREGVGNVSAGAPHNTSPGDGGNCQHAVNNGTVFSQIADPVTGTLLANPGIFFGSGGTVVVPTYLLIPGDDGPAAWRWGSA
jgi:hypothetical protein